MSSAPPSAVALPWEPAKPAPARLEGVQALRFLAALLVVIGHCQHEAVAALGDQAGAAGFIAFDWGLGVDVFFAISGFIMWHLMQDSFGRPGEAQRFLRRRVLRIVPIYWLGTTAIALATLSTFSAAESVPFALASYLFVPWPHPDGRGLFPVLTLGWTLNYEMMFYCVFALALTLPRRLGLTLLLSVFAALFVAARLAPPQAFMLKFWGDPIIFEFLFGIGLAALHRHGTALPGWASLALAAAGFLLATAFYQTGAYHQLARSITGGLPALLIVGAVVLGPALSARSWPPRMAVLGGDASYALYLAHPFALKAVAAVSARLGLWTVAPALPVLAMLGAAIVVFLLIYRFVERPILTLLQRHFARPAMRPGS